MSALRVTMSASEFKEQQIREGLDGRYVALHFSGRAVQLTVPPDFDPYSREGETLIRQAIAQKVLGK